MKFEINVVQSGYHQIPLKNKSLHLIYSLFILRIKAGWKYNWNGVILVKRVHLFSYTLDSISIWNHSKILFHDCLWKFGSHLTWIPCKWSPLLKIIFKQKSCAGPLTALEHCLFMSVSHSKHWVPGSSQRQWHRQSLQYHCKVPSTAFLAQRLVQKPIAITSKKWSK